MVFRKADDRGVPTVNSMMVEQIRSGESQAWKELIACYEGRLLAYVQSRLQNSAASEDVVQETFIGFLRSLPHYDPTRSLESYLFSIAAYKLTDFLRREGRRPTLPLSSASNTSGERDPPSPARAPSSVVRSDERQALEETALIEAVRHEINRWRDRGEWRKMECLELLFVHGSTNREAASILQLSGQQVANYKFDFLAKIRRSVSHQGLPVDVFPQLDSPPPKT